MSILRSNIKGNRLPVPVIVISGLFFALLLLFWGILYPNHLAQKEQMQMFLLGSDYLFQHLSYQGGLAIWLGEFFTQLFLYPWTGALIISLLIFSIYYSTQRVFQLLFREHFYVLAFLPAAGYCFMLFNDFYYVSGVLAVGTTIWCIVVYPGIKTLNRRFWTGLLFIILLYWFMGGAYLLFGLSIILIELIFYFRRTEQGVLPSRLVLVIAGYLMAGIFIPLIARKFFILDSFVQSYFSPAYYKFDLVVPSFVILIIMSVPVLILFQELMKMIISAKLEKFLQYGFGFLMILFMGYGFYYFSNLEEEKEMKYDNLVYRKQWFEIIKNAEKDPPSGKQARLALMLALGKTGQLSNRLFSFNPHTGDFFIPYEMHGMAPLIASEPYYYIGLINFAQMLAMETIESTPDAVKPVRAVKRYAETCIINGQYDVAARYLRYLRKTLFYRKWAKDAFQYLNNEAKVNAHPEWGKLRTCLVKDDFYFNQGNEELALISLLRSNSGNRLAYEYLMSAELLKKDFDEFLKYLPLYKLFNFGNMPLVFQEALAYIETLLPEYPANSTEMAISSEVRNRLALYADAFKQGGSKNPALMKQSFGNTYWYYLHFSGNHEK